MISIEMFSIAVTIDLINILNKINTNYIAIADNLEVNINIYSIEQNWDSKKLQYDKITRCDEYE